MEELYSDLKELQTTLQTLLKKYNNLKKENESLREEIAGIMDRLSEKQKLIEVSEEKLASTGITAIYNEEEKQLLRSKIDLYLKEIEKCLALLNA
jgi:regulator of replication initiation timing